MSTLFMPLIFFKSITVGNFTVSFFGSNRYISFFSQLLFLISTMGKKKSINQCEHCAAFFDRPSRLVSHLRTHTGERPFVCEYEDCGKSYSKSTHLKRHEATHEESHKCTVDGCSEVLKTKSTLKRHIDNMHQKKKQKLYKCTECDKDFNKHNWLKSHMVKQHGAKWPYKCPIEECGKEFLLQSRLKVHMKIHCGYKCKIPGCEEVLLRWSVYVTHLKQFHPKVHKCNICEKVFSHACNLKSHKEVHKQTRKVFPCNMPNCSRFYFAEKNLVWHEKTYHDARPFVCDTESCHRAFKTQDDLDCHKLNHIKAKRQKKKKHRPKFAAVVSGCADPRKFTRKMPPKRVTTESSDEFTTDEEVTCDQDTSIGESSRRNSDLEVIGSEEEKMDDSSQQSYRKLPLKRVRLHSSNEYLSVVEEVCMDIETPQIDESQTAFEEEVEDQDLRLTDSIESIPGETSNWEPPSKRAKLNAEENDFSSNERTNFVLKETGSEKPVVESDHDTATNSSECMLNTSLDDSSSEYETITVTILGGFADKYYSESDEMNSCLSDIGG